MIITRTKTPINKILETRMEGVQADRVGFSPRRGSMTSLRRGRNFKGGSGQLQSAGDGDVPPWLRDLQISTQSGKARLWTLKQRQPRHLVLNGEGSMTRR
ncbi:hypothetical protein M6B38_417410 [Iris pallida]|uniref:Uncharacterized protein n=1 Tax=Iris pallida TaxID=29817 RepID=A0AAX6FIJ4_IRIPA|nr:hypothetical protein M6B38_417410 [Iris pallida]